MEYPFRVHILLYIPFVIVTLLGTSLGLGSAKVNIPKEESSKWRFKSLNVPSSDLN